MEHSDDMQKWFEGTANRVKIKSEELEQVYLRPAYVQGHRLAHERPFVFTFSAVLATLSLAPISFFVLFSIFSLLFILFLAGTFAVLSTFAIFCIAGTLLLGALACCFFLGLYLTLIGVFGYIGWRLIILIREAGTWKEGYQQWLHETIVLALGNPESGNPQLTPYTRATSATSHAAAKEESEAGVRSEDSEGVLMEKLSKSESKEDH